MRYVSEAAGMEQMGLRVYDVAPGEEIPLSGLHYHETQEEAFYVLEGELSVETPDRVYRVDQESSSSPTPRAHTGHTTTPKPERK